MKQKLTSNRSRTNSTKEKEANKAEEQTEKVDDLELSSEQAGVGSSRNRKYGIRQNQSQV